ncbi:hypothetical protein VTN00DRAFT_7960 [Thermoascus crustaceus]|uniref:uncharacterized protein n=1 Tax=Thermoascus crustaceus TaxID=5088 RepID=UPI0037446820
MAVDDEGPKVTIVMWVVTIVPLVIICLRVYCKFLIGSRLGWDDWIVILSWILLAIYTALITLSVKSGLGKHLVDLLHEPPPANVPLAMKYVLIGEVVAIVGCCLSKTSFAFTLLRIVVEKWQKVLLWFIIISMNLVMDLCALFYVIKCVPVEANWDTSIPAKCWPLEAVNNFAIFAGAYSGLMDFMLALLPWKIVWSLQMKTREKIGIGLAMSLGIFAAVSAFVKTSYLPDLNKTYDITYFAGNLLLWAAAETGLTIVAVSLPSLRALLTKLRSSRNYSSGREQSNGYQLSSGGGKVRNSISRGGVFSGNYRNKGTVLPTKRDDQSDKSILSAAQGGNGTKSYIKQTNEITISYDHDGNHSYESVIINSH